MQEVVVSWHTGHLTRLADILVVVMMINFLVILPAVVDVDVVLMKQLKLYYWSVYQQSRCEILYNEFDINVCQN